MLMRGTIEFEAVLLRLGEAFLIEGRPTQVKLAEALGIRQSSISDAKRRNSIPAEWFVKALEIGGVDPDWIRTGEGPKFRVLSDEATGALTITELKKRIAEENQREMSSQELMDALLVKLPGAFISIQYGGQGGQSCGK
ncbi:helix-turn-helix domain-containing protein [Maridesulfovibrio frigidus]|uniref:helix-turn-helix domain-containing protein n=1 Tax=Maridesulfovibrio frigidus TaxID=340956 RepID=UPI00068F6AB3